MILLPPELVTVDEEILEEIDENIRSLYRLIVFSAGHRATDLLTRYQEAVHHLQEVLSIKNAQQEAQTPEEAEIYLEHLKDCLSMIVGEIGDDRQIRSPVDLFRLFRRIAPDAEARHPNSYRRKIVQFGACAAPLPEEVAGLVDQLFAVLPEVRHPAVRAAYLHHELVRIHPFVDGNGRVSRMAKNWLLMYELYPPIFIYSGDERARYIKSLEASFLALAEKPFECGEATQHFMREEIRRIKASTRFILDRMIKNPGGEFGDADMDSTPHAARPKRQRPQ